MYNWRLLSLILQTDVNPLPTSGKVQRKQDGASGLQRSSQAYQDKVVGASCGSVYCETVRQGNKARKADAPFHVRGVITFPATQAIPI